jgi:hypothetical protein
MNITFLRDTDDGQMFRTKLVRKIQDTDAENHKNIKFLCELGEGEFDEVLTCQELSNIIEDQHMVEEEDTEKSVVYKSVTGHQGPMPSKHKDYKGLLELPGD